LHDFGSCNQPNCGINLVGIFTYQESLLLDGAILQQWQKDWFDFA